MKNLIAQLKAFLFGADVDPKLKKWTYISKSGAVHNFKKRPWRMFFRKILTVAVMLVPLSATSQTYTFKSAGIQKVEVVNSTTTPVVVNSTGPIGVSASDLDIRNLTFATDKVDVGGSTVVIRSTGAISVNASDLDIRNLTFATDKADITGSGAYLRDPFGNSIATGEPTSATDDLPPAGLVMHFSGVVPFGVRTDNGNLQRLRVNATGQAEIEVKASTVGVRNDDFAGFPSYAIEGKECTTACAVTFLGRPKSWLFSVKGGTATFTVNSSSTVVASGGEIWQDDFLPRIASATLNLASISVGSTAQLMISGAR